MITCFTSCLLEIKTILQVYDNSVVKTYPQIMKQITKNWKRFVRCAKSGDHLVLRRMPQINSVRAIVD